MWFVWPVPVFLAATAVLVAILLLGRRLFPGAHTTRHAFWCPFRSTNVRVDFRKSIWDGQALEVEACSEFPADVKCEKACLLLAKLPAVRAEVATTAH